MKKSLNYPPYGGFKLNNATPLTKGLVFWAPLIDALQRDRVLGLPFTPTAGPALGNTADGLGWKFLRTSSQYLITADTPVIAAPLTISCWFYPTQVASSRDLVTIANNGNTTDYFQMQCVGGGGVQARIGAGGGNSTAASSFNATANVWNMGTVVFASATSRWSYTNAMGKVTNATNRSPAGVNKIGVGALISSTIPTASYFDGYIRNVTIWNRALSDAEVWLLYQQGSRWDLFDAAIWNSAQADSAAPAVNQISRPVRPVRSVGLPIFQLRI